MGQPVQGIIPAAVADNSNNSGNSSGGAVSGTDSESEPDTMGRMVKDLSAINWNATLEGKLEDILIRNVFDFKLAAKEFQRYVNSSDNPDEAKTLFFKIDPKTLQLKWTDIEIRKHVIPTMQKEQKEEADAASVEDDDLPPLEEVKEDDKLTKPTAKASAAPSTDESSKESVSASASRATPVFNYSDEDDENESAASNAPSQSAST